MNERLTDALRRAEEGAQEVREFCEDHADLLGSEIVKAALECHKKILDLITKRMELDQ